jgi:AmmeMemoRadiSam system protein B
MYPSRTPAGSGTLYPALPARLRADVRAYLDAAPAAPRRATGVLVPHGPLAAAGAVLGAAFGAVDVPAVCILLGPNHSMRARAPNGGSLLTAAAYRTPLGDLTPDDALAAALVAGAGDLLAEDPVAHDEETALEVVLPFLQVRRADVRIVPILLAWSTWEPVRALAHAIAGAIAGRNDVLLVASSDMNHYESETITADKSALALDSIVATDPEGLLAVTAEHSISMCGRAAVACALEVARLQGKHVGEVVGYGHSGVRSGATEEVTGYAAALIGLA